MIDIEDKLLRKLADDFVELQANGGLELEFWDTAKKFVDNFYESQTTIKFGSKLYEDWN